MSVDAIRSSIVIIPPGKNHSQNAYNGQKGAGNCFLYSIKIATSMHEIALDPSFKRNLSVFRKSITAVSFNWSLRIIILKTLDTFKSLEFESTDSLTKKQIECSVSAVIVMISPLFMKEPPSKYFPKKDTKEMKYEKVRQEAIKFLSGFLNSDIEKLDDYVKHLKAEERIQIYTQFLSAEGVDLDALLLEKDQELLKIGVTSKLHSLHHIFNDRIAATFTMQFQSDWTPNQGIDEIIEMLKEKGALVVPTKLSGFMSTNLPIALKETNPTYSIYGWPSGTMKERTDVRQGHTIVVVDARKKPQEVIYFLDPADESPLGEKRVAYKISYELFCKKVIGKYGIDNPENPSDSRYSQKYLLHYENK